MLEEKHCSGRRVDEPSTGVDLISYLLSILPYQSLCWILTVHLKILLFKSRSVVIIDVFTQCHHTFLHRIKAIKCKTLCTVPILVSFLFIATTFEFSLDNSLWFIFIYIYNFVIVSIVRWTFFIIFSVFFF